MNKIELISGKPYSLRSLFSGDHRKIIIPDLQRDYCWAEVKNKEKVSLVYAFIDSLLDYFDNRKEGEDMNLGLIYAYEDPTDFVHLCDGQQRLTTLYLLIGVLYRRTGIDILKNCLISDYELDEDDHEGYLQYAIRDTSLFFLNELVYNYFINHEEAGLKKWDDNYYAFSSPWFFDRYKNDKTINNICTAVHQIDKKLTKYFAPEMNRTEELFVDFLLNQIKLLYYDVNNRKQGEEMYVVINTTGLELTTTENLKPNLLGDFYDELFEKYWNDKDLIESKITSYNKEWEDREDFFWENKHNDSKDKEQVADNGLSDFLSWILIIESKSDVNSGKLVPNVKEFRKWKAKVDLTSEELLKSIESYYISLQKIIKGLNSNNNLSVFNSLIANGRDFQLTEVSLAALRKLTSDTTQQDSITQQQFFLIPLLAFVNKFGDATSDDIDVLIRFLRYNFYSKKRLKKGFDSKVLKETIDICSSVQDCFETLFSSNFILKEEFRALDDKLVDGWCNDWDFMGNLSPLFEAALMNSEEKIASFDMLEELKNYMNAYHQLQDVTYRNSTEKINKELISFSNLLTFRFYNNLSARSGTTQNQEYRSIDIVKNNDYFILSNTEDFNKLWGKLIVNGIVEAQNALVDSLSPKIGIMTAGQFWLLLICSESSKLGRTLNNYIGNKNLGLSYYHNNPHDYWAGGKIYSLNKLNKNWELYNSVGNTFVGATYYNKKSPGFNDVNGSIIAAVQKFDEFSDIEFQIKDREAYFYSTIDEVYGLNLKHRFNYSEKHKSNEIRFQLYEKIKDRVESQAEVLYFEVESVEANPLNDFITNGYSELDWFTVGIPVEKKCIIAVTSDRQTIQFGLRKHPETKPEEQQEILEQLKMIGSVRLQNVNLLHNGWWYLYNDVRFDEKCYDVDFFVQYLLELYSEISTQADILVIESAIENY